MFLNFSKELFKVKGEGIINIVSYGYHEGPVKNIREVFDEDNTPKTEYINACRKKEIEQLNEWISWVSPNMINWVITIVSKADVWWEDNWDDVKKYYEEDEYGSKMSTLVNKGVKHIILPYSSIIEPFYEIKRAQGFGETLKNNFNDRFLKELSNLLNTTK